MTITISIMTIVMNITIYEDYQRFRQLPPITNALCFNKRKTVFSKPERNLEYIALKLVYAHARS